MPNLGFTLVFDAKKGAGVKDFQDFVNTIQNTPKRFEFQIDAQKAATQFHRDLQQQINQLQPITMRVGIDQQYLQSQILQATQQVQAGIAPAVTRIQNAAGGATPAAVAAANVQAVASGTTLTSGQLAKAQNDAIKQALGQYGVTDLIRHIFGGEGRAVAGFSGRLREQEQLRNLPQGLLLQVLQDRAQTRPGSVLGPLARGGNLVQTDILRNVAFSAIFGGPGAAAASALGGITPLGVRGAQLGNVLFQGTATILGGLKDSLNAVADKFTEAGKTFEQSVLSITAILQSNTDIVGVGGRQLNVRQQLQFQESEAGRIQFASVDRLRRLGVSGTTEGSIVSAVTSAVSQRGLQLSPDQLATVSERVTAAIVALRPQLLDNPTLLVRDIQDTLAGGPLSQKTLLSQLIRPVFPGINQAQTALQFVNSTNPLAQFPETVLNSNNPAAVRQRLVGAQNALETAAGVNFVQTITPAMKELTEVLARPETVQAYESLGKVAGDFDAFAIRIAASFQSVATSVSGGVNQLIGGFLGVHQTIPLILASLAGLTAFRGRAAIGQVGAGIGSSFSSGVSDSLNAAQQLGSSVQFARAAFQQGFSGTGFRVPSLGQAKFRVSTFGSQLQEAFTSPFAGLRDERSPLEQIKLPFLQSLFGGELPESRLQQRRLSLFNGSLTSALQFRRGFPASSPKGPEVFGPPSPFAGLSTLQISRLRESGGIEQLLATGQLPAAPRARFGFSFPNLFGRRAVASEEEFGPANLSSLQKNLLRNQGASRLDFQDTFQPGSAAPGFRSARAPFDFGAFLQQAGFNVAGGAVDLLRSGRERIDAGREAIAAQFRYGAPGADAVDRVTFAANRLRRGATQRIDSFQRGVSDRLSDVADNPVVQAAASDLAAGAKAIGRAADSVKTRSDQFGQALVNSAGVIKAAAASTAKFTVDGAIAFKAGLLGAAGVIGASGRGLLTGTGVGQGLLTSAFGSVIGAQGPASPVGGFGTQRLPGLLGRGALRGALPFAGNLLGTAGAQFLTNPAIAVAGLGFQSAVEFAQAQAQDQVDANDSLSKAVATQQLIGATSERSAGGRLRSLFSRFGLDEDFTKFTREKLSGPDKLINEILKSAQDPNVARSPEFKERFQFISQSALPQAIQAEFAKSSSGVFQGSPSARLAESQREQDTAVPAIFESLKAGLAAANAAVADASSPEGIRKRQQEARESIARLDREAGGARRGLVDIQLRKEEAQGAVAEKEKFQSIASPILGSLANVFGAGLPTLFGLDVGQSLAPTAERAAAAKAQAEELDKKQEINAKLREQKEARAELDKIAQGGGLDQALRDRLDAERKISEEANRRIGLAQQETEFAQQRLALVRGAFDTSTVSGKRSELATEGERFAPILSGFDKQGQLLEQSIETAQRTLTSAQRELNKDPENEELQKRVNEAQAQITAAQGGLADLPFQRGATEVALSKNITSRFSSAANVGELERSRLTDVSDIDRARRFQIDEQDAAARAAIAPTVAAAIKSAGLSADTQKSALEAVETARIKDIQAQSAAVTGGALNRLNVRDDDRKVEEARLNLKSALGEEVAKRTELNNSLKTSTEALENFGRTANLRALGKEGELLAIADQIKAKGGSVPIQLDPSSDARQRLELDLLKAKGNELATEVTGSPNTFGIPGRGLGFVSTQKDTQFGRQLENEQAGLQATIVKTAVELERLPIALARAADQLEALVIQQQARKTPGDQVVDRNRVNITAGGAGDTPGGALRRDQQEAFSQVENRTLKNFLSQSNTSIQAYDNVAGGAYFDRQKNSLIADPKFLATKEGQKKVLEDIGGMKYEEYTQDPANKAYMSEIFRAEREDAGVNNPSLDGSNDEIFRKVFAEQATGQTDGAYSTEFKQLADYIKTIVDDIGGVPRASEKDATAPGASGDVAKQIQAFTQLVQQLQTQGIKVDFDAAKFASALVGAINGSTTGGPAN